MSLEITINNEDDPLLRINRPTNVTILLDSGNRRSYLCPSQQSKTGETGGVPANIDGNVTRQRRSPEDEMLLTEVGIDHPSIIIYDITGLYINVTTDVVHTRIKCFKNENEKDFYLILNDDDQVNKFNSTFL